MTTTLKLTSYNMHNQELRSGDIIFNHSEQTMTSPSGKVYKVITDYDFTFKINRKSKVIKAVRGVDGLIDFLTHINNHKSAFNPYCTDKFINL